jgi:hypothetical protein
VSTCVTRNHSTLIQTPVWRSRLDFMGTVHFVEGCDGSSSIDVSFVHVNFHREPYKNIRVVEEYLGFLARESHCICYASLNRLYDLFISPSGHKLWYYVSVLVPTTLSMKNRPTVFWLVNRVVQYSFGLLFHPDNGISMSPFNVCILGSSWISSEFENTDPYFASPRPLWSLQLQSCNGAMIHFCRESHDRKNERYRCLCRRPTCCNEVTANKHHVVSLP